MSKSPKGDNPGDRSQDGGKRESWENIDYGWEHLEAPLPEGAPTLQQKLPGGLVPELTPPEPAPTDLDSAAPLNLDLTPPPPSRPQARGLRTLQMDRPARGLRTLVDEGAPQERDPAPLAPLTIDEEVEAEELPTPNPVEEHGAVARLDDTLPLRDEGSPADSGDWEARALPVAPPGHRRVARTIVGLGAPDLQALMRAEKIVRSAAAGDLHTDEVPIFVAQSAVEEASTLKARRPAAPPVATNETARRLSALDDAETSVEARVSEPPPTPRGPSVQRLVVPEPGSAVFDDDVIEYAKTPPPEEASITRQPVSEKTPREPAPREAPTPRKAAPEPAPAPPSPALSVRRRDEAAPPVLSPAAPVEPPVVMPPSLLRPSLVQAPAQGPSNLTLAILWIVAVASVGLAIFLYATRG